jgi:MerR family transcriptional regulator, redox-sensitive transcriptional activator SoxR
MTISELAHQARIPISAIRYYEKVGLLPQPRRVSGRRIYGSDALDYLALIRFGQWAGFSLRELKFLMTRFGSHSDRSELVRRKLLELKRVRDHIDHMERRLEDFLLCSCTTIKDWHEQVIKRGETSRIAGFQEKATQNQDLPLLKLFLLMLASAPKPGKALAK